MKSFRTDFKRIVIPYFIFTIIFIPVQIYKDIYGIDGAIGGSISIYDFKPSITNRPLWFLIVLFLLRIISYAYLKSRCQNWLKIMGAIILSIAGYFMVFYKPTLFPESVSRTLVVFSIWFSGYYFGKRLLQKYKLGALFCGMFLFILIMGVKLGHLSDIMLLKINDNLYWFYSLAISGIILILFMSNILSSYKNVRFVRMLAFLGRNSLYIFCLHWPLIGVLQYWMEGFPSFIVQFVIFVVVVVFSITLGGVLYRLLPSLFPKFN